MYQTISIMKRIFTAIKDSDPIEHVHATMFIKGNRYTVTDRKDPRDNFYTVSGVFKNSLGGKESKEQGIHKTECANCLGIKGYTLFRKTRAKEDICLYNTEVTFKNKDFGVHPEIKVNKGEEIEVWEQHFSDGRIYYTAFRKGFDSEYYTYTHMRDASGKLVRNCGGIQASRELRILLS